MAYQQGSGLSATGVANLATWTSILATGPRMVLKYGSATHAVRRVQRALNAAVAARLPITGVYYSSTTAAVKKYQGIRGLPQTGVVADATWAQLEAGRR